MKLSGDSRMDTIFLTEAICLSSCNERSSVTHSVTICRTLACLQQREIEGLFVRRVRWPWRGGWGLGFRV
jgi:hypothetical protein